LTVSVISCKANCYQIILVPPDDRAAQSEDTAVYAVVVRESGDPGQIEASAGLVQANVAPQVARAPGFVSALWMSDGAGGTLNVLTFESEAAARAALDAARDAPRPPFMKVERVDLLRVLAAV
jgi:hypothetical protein